MAQTIRPNGQVALAVALPAEVAAAFQRLVQERDSTVSAELRRLVADHLASERKDDHAAR